MPGVGLLPDVDALQTRRLITLVLASVPNLDQELEHRGRPRVELGWKILNHPPRALLRLRTAVLNESDDGRDRLRPNQLVLPPTLDGSRLHDEQDFSEVERVKLEVLRPIEDTPAYFCAR